MTGKMDNLRVVATRRVGGWYMAEVRRVRGKGLGDIVSECPPREGHHHPTWQGAHLCGMRQYDDLAREEPV